ncbi:sensor histidine kinase [Luteimonas sp. RIT-PG2_3]|jgi:PAS domain S-box-containing protein
MPPSLPTFLSARWQWPAMALAIAAIVIAPFLFIRWTTLEAEEASRAVKHSREVESRMLWIAADTRSLEAAALTLTRGIDSPLLQERIQQAHARVQPNLERVLELTRDNPDQQVRLGALRSHVEERTARAMGVIAKHGKAGDEEIDDMIRLYPVHRLIDGFLKEEQLLLEERVVRADRTSLYATITAWVAMVAQLALLGGAGWFARRQWGRRQEAEGHAQRASHRAAAVLDTVREPIVLVDGEQRIVMHNAAFAELYGVEGDMRGQPLAQIGDGAWDHAETLRRLHDVLARDRELWDYQQLQRSADGAERTMLINARRMPLPDRDEEVALVTASDITAQAINERQVRELNQQLQGKVEQVSDVNRELEAFSYSVSHDLRAPLRHIAGFADKLGRHLGDGLDDKSTHYLGVIATSAKRMSALIDDLLVYSRLGRSALRLQGVDMQSLVAETRAMLDSASSSEQPGHHIHWRIQPLPVVVGDENMLRQVWQNLLGNAVKYSSNREPAEIEVTCRTLEGGGHEFTVRDNGAGFDMQYAGKLFGVFQRLHSPSEFPGTGVGLASVRRVLGRHGGQIRAEAELGQGATFHFTLPAPGEVGSNQGSKPNE